MSKAEMKECSEQAKYWVTGFLAGNEPSPPETKDGDVDFASPEYKAWQLTIEVFNQTGYWPEDEGETTGA